MATTQGALSGAINIPSVIMQQCTISTIQFFTIGDLPDSYFEPTAGEIFSLHQSRVAARERLVDAPLRTSLIREREEKEREAKYPFVSDISHL